MSATRLSSTEVIAARGEAWFKVLITQEHPSHGPLFDLPRHLGDKMPAVDYFVELASAAAVAAFCLIQVKHPSGVYARWAPEGLRQRCGDGAARPVRCSHIPGGNR